MRPQLILVSVELGPEGLLYASSHDIRGLHVVASNRNELMLKTGQAIENLHKAAGRSVTARQVESPSEQILIWVAVPNALEFDQCA